MEILNAVIDAAQAMTFLEILGVLLGVLSVWFSKKENILVFPTGIFSVLIYAYLCFGVKLYADMGINIFYFVMSVYGWYNWNSEAKNKQLEIKRNSRIENYFSILSIIILWLTLNYLLSNFTDSDVAYIDSFTTAVCFVGMWLMAWKRLENWIMWIVADIVSVPLYWYKDFYLTSFQFVFFTILAIAGFVEWKNKLVTK